MKLKVSYTHDSMDIAASSPNQKHDVMTLLFWTTNTVNWYVALSVQQLGGGHTAHQLIVDFMEFNGKWEAHSNGTSLIST